MDGFTISPVEGLRSPVVVLAFSGWSDSGTVSTDAAKRLVESFPSERFLTVDPEEYYVFTETRPHVRIAGDGSRILDWPENEAWGLRLEESANDLIVVRGVEPNLRWRTFGERMAEGLMALEPSLVCTIGARQAPTPHTRPTPIAGSSADPGLAAKYGLGASRYQGPTGIIGVLHEALRSRGANLISLFANVPHYLSVAENPPATLALLKALEPVVGFKAPIGDLEEESVRFVERVEEASRGDEQIGTYVRSLEEQYGFFEQAEDLAPQGGEPAELPSTDDLLKDVEDFLRRSNDP